ncbi:hypothetical protein ACVWWO_000340 [Bradyrhizobium sp. F1.13.1]
MFSHPRSSGGDEQPSTFCTRPPLPTMSTNPSDVMFAGSQEDSGSGSLEGMMAKIGSCRDIRCAIRVCGTGSRAALCIRSLSSAADRQYLGRKSSRTRLRLQCGVTLIDRNFARGWKPMLHELAAGTANYSTQSFSFAPIAKKMDSTTGAPSFAGSTARHSGARAHQVARSASFPAARSRTHICDRKPYQRLRHERALLIHG